MLPSGERPVKSQAGNSSWWGAVVSAGALTFAPLFAFVLVVGSFFAGRPPRWREVILWTLPWIPMLLLGVIRSVMGASSPDLVVWPLLAMGVGYASLRLDVSPSTGFLVGAVLVTVGLMGERIVAASTWHPVGDVAVTASRIPGVLGTQTSTATEGVARLERFYRPPVDDVGVVAHLDVRLVDGTVGRAWFTPNPDITIEPLEGGSDAVRVTLPSAGAGYVNRHVSTGEPLAGRTFVLQARVRTPEPLTWTSEACLGLILQERDGAGNRACFDGEFDATWRDVALTWTAPMNATSPDLQVELRFPVPWFEIADVTLVERQGNTSIQLGAFEPTGVRLALALPGQPASTWPSTSLLPAREVQTLELVVDSEQVAAAGERLRFVVRQEAGSTVTLAAMRVEDEMGGVLGAYARPERGSAWFGHPNVAAHGLALAGVMAVTLARAWPIAVIASIVTLVGTLMTGSRSGLIVLAVFLPVLLSRWLPPLQRRLAVSLAIVLALGAAGYLFLPSLVGDAITLPGRFDPNDVSRLEIWSFAWQAMQAHPWLGVGEGGFPAAWQAAHVGDVRATPVHAHNLFLGYGASYGYPGLVMMLVWALGLIAFAWRRHGAWGVLALLAPLALWQVDDTLRYGSIFLILLLFLTARPPREDTA